MNSQLDRRVRINEQIRISPVMVIKDGENLGNMTCFDAIKMAREEGLDLVEISPNSRPPVCLVIDYNKFKYEEKKKRKISEKKSSKSLGLKEIRLSYNIDPHDVEIKAKQGIRFLEEGYRVKLNLKFESRELSHKDIGFNVITNFLKLVSEFGKPQSPPKLDGKYLGCIIDVLDVKQKADKLNL